jgi:hypothetical protein
LVNINGGGANLILNSRKRQQMHRKQTTGFTQLYSDPDYKVAMDKACGSIPWSSMNDIKKLDTLLTIGVVAVGSTPAHMWVDMAWKQNLTKYIVG